MTTSAPKTNRPNRVVPSGARAGDQETDFAAAVLTLADNARPAKTAAVKPPAGDRPADGRIPLGAMPVAMGSIGASAWDVEPVKPEDFVESLQKQLQTLESGDMSNVEAMLYTQAVTLQSMFVRLSTDVMTRSTLSEQQQILALAFKAQAQCRQTLETLGNVKFPRATTFVRQANIANGPQQVNNNAGTEPERHAMSRDVTASHAATANRATNPAPPAPVRHLRGAASAPLGAAAASASSQRGGRAAARAHGKAKRDSEQNEVSGSEAPDV